ncbi:prepilin peptidase [Candidatus Woesearchaeota archaeon]|nr:prepilin peptidase [Candidatus Woesearchaeota archaeon]
MDLIPFIVGLGFLLVASIHDMRTREVPDLVSYGLLLFAIAYGFAKSIVLWNWVPMVQMLLGLVAMIALGFLLYYTGQWGGADSKLLMGLGALLGLGFGTIDTVLFLVLMLLAGAVYGTLYTLSLVVKEWKVFKPAFVKEIRRPLIHRLRKIVLVLGFLLVIAVLLTPFAEKTILVLLLVMLYFLFYAWLIVKTVEKSVLIKTYPVEKLTEGDWIQEEVKVKGKLICGPKDLGITNKQIAKLKRLKVKKVVVKEGIPFVPSFLLGFILLWATGGFVYRLLPF